MGDPQSDQSGSDVERGRALLREARGWVVVDSDDCDHRPAVELRKRIDAYLDAPAFDEEPVRCDCGAAEGNFHTAHPSGHAVTCATRKLAYDDVRVDPRGGEQR